jgi:hypothetical protein
VRYVPSAENRSHGSALGAKAHAFCNATRSATCSVAEGRTSATLRAVPLEVRTNDEAHNAPL